MKKISETPPPISITDDGADRLRFAIVERAILDYLDVLAGFVKESVDTNVKELEKFFKSAWFKELCDLDGEYIMESIKEKAKKMVLKYIICKEKGSSRYYVSEVGSTMPIPGTTGMTKKQALHKAADMNDLDYKDYMKVRKRDGVKC